MLPLSLNMNIRTLLFAFVISMVCGQDRKIKSYLNPGCEHCMHEVLVYTQSIGPADTIHQLWDFTRGCPTVIFAIAGVNSSLSITWDIARRSSDNQFVPKRFDFSEEPKYSFAASFDQLFEYNDLDDCGYIDKRSPRKEYSLNDIKWERNTSFSDTEVALDVRGQFRGGAVEVKLDLIPWRDYSAHLPHLIHSANSTLVDISLVNITTNARFNASRYALQLQLVATEGAGDSFHYNMRKSLDDEHTPGVFEIVEIKTPRTYHGGDGGFIQFRPVGYTQPERGVTTATKATTSPFDRTQLSPHSTLWAFYLGRQSSLLTQQVFVSFGEPADGFYRMHNYTAWSFTIGYGSPPLEGFSPLVVGIIAVGLAVPVLLALSGLVYVYVVSRRTHAHSRLVE